jgi:hypothetical protein
LRRCYSSAIIIEEVVNMETLKAHYTVNAKEDSQGLNYLDCPICGGSIHETDIETYFCKGYPESELDSCTDCREDFENEYEQNLDSDELESGVFSDFIVYAYESMDIPELDVKKATREANRTKWKDCSGIPGDDEGFEHTVAIWHFPCGCWFEEFENFGKTEYQVTVGNAGWLESSSEAIARHLHYWHCSEHKHENQT